MAHFLIVTLLLGVLLVGMALRRCSPRGLMRTLAGGLLAVNGLVAVAGLSLALLLSFDTPATAFAAPALQQEGGEPAAESQQNSLAQMTMIGAALATGLAAIGAGIAVGIAGAAAIGAITEKPEVLGRALIFVGLAEGIAIYGLIISFLILTGGLGGGG